MLGRFHLTYANVMVTLLAFIVLGGGAYAAGHVDKNSVGTKQLKKGAVTKAKIKKNAVVAAKIGGEAVTTRNLGNGSVTGPKIDPASTTFARIVRYSVGVQKVSIYGAPTLYPLGDSAFLQNAEELNMFAAAIRVEFGSSCTPPRSVEAFLLIDAAEPNALKAEDIAAAGKIENNDTGTFATQIALSSAPGYPKATLFQPVEDTQHVLYLVAEGKCTTGEDVSATVGLVDVIGMKYQVLGGLAGP